jgi:hypothetical protein
VPDGPQPAFAHGGTNRGCSPASALRFELPRLFSPIDVHTGKCPSMVQEGRQECPRSGKMQVDGKIRYYQNGNKAKRHESEIDIK